MDSERESRDDPRTLNLNMLPVEAVRTKETNSESKLAPYQFFNLQHRIKFLPFLKKSIHPDMVLKWKDEPLRGALSSAAASKKYTKLVSDLDEMIRSTLHCRGDLNLELINKYLHVGVFEEGGKLRDEIYLQVLRQIKGNPMTEQVERAWKLMICVTGAFPPSKGLFSWIQGQIDYVSSDIEFYDNDDFLVRTRKCCERNLYVFSISGPRGYSTSLEDVNFWFNEAYKVPGVFGVHLEEIYEHADLLENYNRERIPKIVIKLLTMIKNLGGFKKEGIFRISGELQQVFKLKNHLSMNSTNDNSLGQCMTCTTIKDPSVPCSTLKLWMRVLKGPLIPENLYLQFLQARNDHTTLTRLLEDALPKPNFSIISVIINFLLELSQDEFQQNTKMGLNNFAMIFAPCFMRCPLTLSPAEILQKSGEERELVRSLFDYFQQLQVK